MYDIMFLSHSEGNADIHWQSLRRRFPRAHRVHGIDGIVNAHKRCADLSETRYFWVVDADNLVQRDFDFSFRWPSHFPVTDAVAVWRARNNMNGLIYGYGGIKLLPKLAVQRISPDVVDFTTSIGENFRIMKDVASLTVINATPFEAWKSGFRECAKLASNVIHRARQEENEERLNTWCTVAEGQHAVEVLRGANAGREYGEANSSDPDALARLNDFVWLKERFDDR